MLTTLHSVAFEKGPFVLILPDNVHSSNSKNNSLIFMFTLYLLVGFMFLNIIIKKYQFLNYKSTFSSYIRIAISQVGL
uniref:Uncharacterized protein n=1 Tax=Anguilla anguilla TaxID=7936 RepID=A0A0E9WQL0_ANGAN